VHVAKFHINVDEVLSRKLPTCCVHVCVTLESQKTDAMTFPVDEIAVVFSEEGFAFSLVSLFLQLI
jgi:hypothetical protein